MGVSKNRCTSNEWFVMENPIKMDDLGDPPLFLETSIWVMKQTWSNMIQDYPIRCFVSPLRPLQEILTDLIGTVRFEGKTGSSNSVLDGFGSAYLGKMSFYDLSAMIFFKTAIRNLLRNTTFLMRFEEECDFWCLWFMMSHAWLSFSIFFTKP